MPSRIGTQALFQTQLSYLMRLQTQQSLVNEQIATGFKSQTFAGVASDSGSIISSKAMMAKIDQYNQNITIATNRSKLMDTSLSSIDKSISTLQGYLAQLSNSKTPPDVPTLAKDLLNQVTDYLNLNDGSRYLFAGSNTQTAPVKTLAYTSGVAPTVPAVPSTLTAAGTPRQTASALPLPTVGPFPAANFDVTSQTFYIPDPDNAETLIEFKQALPPLTTIEVTQDTAANIEIGRVLEDPTTGARARVMYATNTTPAGLGGTARLYVEKLNEFEFTPDGTLSMTELTQVGSTYSETTTATTFTMIGGMRNANIDTQSVELTGPLPSSIAPGGIIDIGNTGNRFIVQSIEPAKTPGGNPVLQVRPLGTATVGSTNVGAGTGRQVFLVDQKTNVSSAVGNVATRTIAGNNYEKIGVIADYRTNNTATGGTGYYTNLEAAREILNPQKVQVSENSTINYGISADQTGFARLIYTLNFLQQQGSPLNSNDVTAANKILAEARTQVTSLRASLGINQKTMVGVQEENTLQKAIANNNFDELAKQDRTEAIATLTSLQTTLEASYQTFASVQNLNLQSFLR